MSVMKLPDSCPSCSGSMLISELTCSECGSQVKGSFTPHPFRMVSGEQRAFMSHSNSWCETNVPVMIEIEGGTRIACRLYQENKG